MSAPCPSWAQALNPGVQGQRKLCTLTLFLIITLFRNLSLVDLTGPRGIQWGDGFYDDVTFPGVSVFADLPTEDEYEKFKPLPDISILLLGAVACRFSFTTGDGGCVELCVQG